MKLDDLYADSHPDLVSWVKQVVHYEALAVALQSEFGSNESVMAELLYRYFKPA